MFLLLHTIILLAFNALVIGLFFYSKIWNYQSKLHPEYKRIFDGFDKVLTPLLDFLKGIMKPYEVGTGLSLDMSQFILLALLLLLINLY